jgi:hypothetical protein
LQIAYIAFNCSMIISVNTLLDAELNWKAVNRVSTIMISQFPVDIIDSNSLQFFRFLSGSFFPVS